MSHVRHPSGALVAPLLITLLALVALLAQLACTSTSRGTVLRADYREAAAELTRLIEHELEVKGIDALSIALTDGDEVVWARGFGQADPEAGLRAGADSVYRVGSISKLFTDVALMQLVEEGALGLDDPLEQHLPGAAPRNPFDGEITLRQLTSHSAGLVREPPVGSYFDATSPTLQATVDSLRDTVLVSEPGTRIKYSNAGLAILGRVLEAHDQRPYAELMRARVLAPLGLSDATFELTPGIEQRLVKSRMWSHDGRSFPAPTFDLGIAPAGNLYASVLDLAAFLVAMASGGEGRVGRVLEPETLKQMWSPTLRPDGRPSNIGIGFLLGELAGRRRVGHNGAVYGCASELWFLPDEQLGVAVSCSTDVANATTRHISDYALLLALAVREQRVLPQLALSKPPSSKQAARLAGRYESEPDPGGSTRRADLYWRNRRLTLEYGNTIGTVRFLDGELMVDDLHTRGRRIQDLGDGTLEIGGSRFTRVSNPRPAPCPERWRELIGEYGWEHNTLFIRERGGRLQALVEWIFLDELTELLPDVFTLPPDRGLYPLERVQFVRDEGGAVEAARFAGILFPRRPAQSSGDTFRITPRFGSDELRRRALAASPPLEQRPLRRPDLVDLAVELPRAQLDIRYATTNNFLTTTLYPTPRAFLQRDAARALRRASLQLEELGYGLRIFDGYRPWHVTKMFWDATPEQLRHFVADPSKGSRHNRGCAVDLTLFDTGTGAPVSMHAGYDEMSERSYVGYLGGTSLERWHRKLLRDAMTDAGFETYEWEWWHFDFGDWREYPILDASFDELDRAARR